MSRIIRSGSRPLRTHNSHDLRSALENYGSKERGSVDDQKQNILRLLNKGANPIKQSSNSLDNALHKMGQAGTPSATNFNNVLSKITNEVDRRTAFQAKNREGLMPAHQFMKQAGNLKAEADFVGKQADDLERQAVKTHGREALDASKPEEKVKEVLDQIKRKRTKEETLNWSSDGFKQMANELNFRGQRLGLNLFEERADSGHTPEEIFNGQKNDPNTEKGLQEEKTMRTKINNGDML